MINIQHITKTFPTVTALDDVSIEIGQHEFFGLLGPNGAGKTTLMNLLVGYLNPENGTIGIAGETVTRDNLDIRKTIGFVPGSIALFDELSARANLELFGALFGLPHKLLKERIDERLCSRIAIIDQGKIIASGTTHELMDMLLYEETIIVAKNPATSKNSAALREFGTLVEADDHYELKHGAGFALSAFFRRVEQEGDRFVTYYNNERYRESLNDVTPADVYRGRHPEIPTRRERLKWRTLKARKRCNLSQPMAQSVPWQKPSSVHLTLKTYTASIPCSCT